MDILELIKKRRTIRQFKDKEIPKEVLLDCLDAARLAPSARNTQPLEYVLITEPKIREEVFDSLSFGGKIPSGRPDEKHRPKAYIIVLYNREIELSMPDVDVGLATENLVLATFSYKLGSCILGAVDREKIHTLCKIPQKYEIKLIVALGYPAEKSVAEDVDEMKEYWRDSQNVLHIPKRKLDNIVHFNKF